MWAQAKMQFRNLVPARVLWFSHPRMPLAVDGAECDALCWRLSRRMSPNPQLEVWVFQIALWAEMTSLCEYLTPHDSSWNFLTIFLFVLFLFFHFFGSAHCDDQRSSSHPLLPWCHSLDLSTVTSLPAVLLLSLTLPLRLSIPWRFCFSFCRYDADMWIFLSIPFHTDNSDIVEFLFLLSPKPAWEVALAWAAGPGDLTLFWP